MDSVLSFVTNYKIVDFAIISMGLAGLFLILERFKALYFDLSLDSQEFMNVVMSLLRENKIEEAITFCGSNQKKPLAHVVKRLLERSDCDDRDIQQALDTSASEIAPALVKRLGHLSMISNVVTLIGLLGTVIGLIMSFKAVSFADVSQKQSLLADGISLAMHSTAMGLLVAIPVMVVYSFLHDKQSKLFSEIDCRAGQVIEFLNLRSYDAYRQMTGKESVASINGGHPPKAAPPPTHHRAS
jgi:biopolymer transport protein ExbB/TolQ